MCNLLLINFKYGGRYGSDSMCISAGGLANRVHFLMACNMIASIIFVKNTEYSRKDFMERVWDAEHFGEEEYSLDALW